MWEGGVVEQRQSNESRLPWVNLNAKLVIYPTFRLQVQPALLLGKYTIYPTFGGIFQQQPSFRFVPAFHRTTSAYAVHEFCVMTPQGSGVQQLHIRYIVWISPPRPPYLRPILIKEIPCGHAVTCIRQIR